MSCNMVSNVEFEIKLLRNSQRNDHSYIAEGIENKIKKLQKIKMCIKNVSEVEPHRTTAES